MIRRRYGTENVSDAGPLLRQTVRSAKLVKLAHVLLNPFQSQVRVLLLHLQGIDYRQRQRVPVWAPLIHSAAHVFATGPPTGVHHV